MEGGAKSRHVSVRTLLASRDSSRSDCSIHTPSPRPPLSTIGVPASSMTSPYSSRPSGTRGVIVAGIVISRVGSIAHLLDRHTPQASALAARHLNHRLVQPGRHDPLKLR